MKIKKQYLYISLALILIIFTSFLYLNFKSSPPSINGGERQIISESPSPNNVKASLTVQDKKYETDIKEGETVFEVMKKIKDESNNTNPFSFKYTENPNLGVFINEINGSIGGEGGYWIYYINGVEAGVGISNYKIKNGDVISWKYEK